MNYNNQKLTNKDMRVIGDELIFGKLFKDLGCENILFKKEEDKEIFKALVVSRLLYPGSKLYLIDYYHIYKKSAPADLFGQFAGVIRTVLK